MRKQSKNFRTETISLTHTHADEIAERAANEDSKAAFIGPLISGSMSQALFESLFDHTPLIDTGR